jgi:RimJ/RimL family protein N-acetyltransferase
LEQLPTSQFHRVTPLIERSAMKGSHAKWYSVLEGKQRGAIFVDDTAAPRTALVCGHQIGAYYAFGEADAGLLRRFVPAFLAEHLTEGYCSLFATSEAWCHTLDALFTTRHTRIAFDFRPSPGCPSMDAEEPVPSGFRLQPMDTAVAGMMSDGICAYLVGRWGGMDAFLQQQIGFCVTFEDQIVSLCAPTVIGGGEAEIQVWTADEFRNRGLARRTAAAFIRQCLARGLKPGWTTDVENLVSRALAPKLGFVPVGEIFGYRLDRSFQLTDGRWGPIPA